MKILAKNLEKVSQHGRVTESPSFFSASRHSASPIHCHNDSFNSSIGLGEEERAITPTYELEGGNLDLDDAQLTKSNIEPKNLLGVCFLKYKTKVFVVFLSS